MRHLLTILAVTAALSGSPACVHAHHSFAAEFDANTPGERSGTIAAIRFANPHVRYEIDVPGTDGTSERWELQAASVTSLREIGWTKDTLKIGDAVTANGLLARKGAHKLYVQRITLGDGRTLTNGGSNNPANDRNSVHATPGRNYGYGKLNDSAPFDISGPWRNSYRFRVTVDDLEPKPTPFTPEGAAIRARTEHYDDYALRCIALGLPRIFGAPYNMDIVDVGTHYLVVYVEHNTPRRIWMDGRSPAPNTPSTAMGFSTGHWENGVLVIETTHLLPGWLDGSGLPMSGDGTRLVERYSFSDDRLSMERELIIHDPYYTAPLRRVRGSARDDNIDITEQNACDPAGYYRDLREAGLLDKYLDE
ncbi:MAG: hypothetical protein H6978_13380 [Gammaproteobacteria bacterium]|nr:hypothetical protein [Gammaproteobacteria bacterium]